MAEYTVDFDMKASHSYTVTAKTAAEAKAKAFQKFKSTRNKRSEYEIWVDKE